MNSISYTVTDSGSLARLKFEIDKNLTYVGPHVDGRQEENIQINAKDSRI